MGTSKTVRGFLLGFLLTLIIVVLFIFDFSSFIRGDWSYIFRKNILYFMYLASKFGWLLILVVIYIGYQIMKNKWVLRLEKMSYGGCTIAFTKPDKLLKQSIQNHLNTKRTVFKINEDKDNFLDTIDSYHKVYKFIRDEIQPYDVELSNTEVYKSANKMIKVLNNFLTDFQSDYRRWYEYSWENNKDEWFNKDIKEIQQNYRHYSEILEGFKMVNREFCELALVFDIDINKWN